MRYRLLFILLIFTCISSFTAKGFAQDNDSTEVGQKPVILYNGTPKKYEIADIKVSGVKNYEDYVLIGISGLAVGQTITVPGDDITSAVKRYWRHGLFSDVKILADKIEDNKIYLSIQLKQRPRITDIVIHGVKKSEREDLMAKLGMAKGTQITPNLVDRAKILIKKHFDEKGFKNAEVIIDQKEDPAKENQVIVDINVNKHEKIKVHKIYIEGNEVISDRKLKRVMKKTNEQRSLIKLFSQKKFVTSDYEDDKNRIIEKYNEMGYRDAKIIADSVVNYSDKKVDVYLHIEEGQKYYISSINWVGNTIFPSAYLDAVLGMKPGDVYNQKMITKRTSEDEDAVANLYMDRGYLFFQLVPIEKNIHGDSIDLELSMMEGPQARINKVTINGNDRLYEKVVRRELYVRPGELFSKSDLMRSAQMIAQTGHFNPETMDIRPEPNEQNGTVDIVFDLESKANDQIEFSAGWGQTGIIGRLSLKFNNFSMKNLFNPSSYKGIIPQGEGQTFTISAQTNARYYQAYSLSFLDPWFGGKRPNSLSVSAYYSRQTGVNSDYYNSTWANSYGNWMYGYGGVYDDYYQYQYEDSYDPNKFLQMAGITVGFGKRLNWPDDYFTLTAELSYQWYYLKNWDYLYYMNNGTSNAIVLGLTLARNSIDNPLYTRRGSQFSLQLQATPPASLFGKKNWKALSEANTDASRQQMYEWIEYWKLKFKSRTYTPLTDPDGKWTLVLMTRADIGLLGSYNRYLKSPFETFYVGGDGMSGSYTYATETIALRGYDNGALTPYGSEGYAYTRFAVELHFPFMLQSSTTIYGLVFAEGGNAWADIKDFSPFDLKRSAGAGVRIFLPMVGMMGIDWAYGFDSVFGEKGGSHFHFVLGQEF